MVRYTVLWRTDVVNDLAALWIAYHERGKLTVATDQIDASLSTDAQLKGVQLRLAQKSLALGPLTVYFRVDEGDRKVTIEGICLTEAN